MMEKLNLTIRPADISEIKNIHNLLLESFMPYKKYYTESAFNATVISTDEITKRIKNTEFCVLVALFKNKITGTASLHQRNKKSLHINTMAVDPRYQNKGIGLQLLQYISDVAKQKNLQQLSLETSKPLEKAIKFYKKFGFKKTGKIRDYFGIEIFEMIKPLK